MASLSSWFPAPFAASQLGDKPPVLGRLEPLLQSGKDLLHLPCEKRFAVQPLLPTPARGNNDHAGFPTAPRYTLRRRPGIIVDAFAKACLHDLWLPGRLQIKNNLGDRMLRLQNGRLHFNWLGQKGGKYPRSNDVRENFLWALKRFSEFLATEKLAEFRPNQWEVTYLNHIPKGTVGMRQGIATSFGHSVVFRRSTG